MRMTWAPPDAPDPAGAIVLSAWVVIPGTIAGPESRSGARIGAAIRTEAAIAAFHYVVGAIATTGG